ncbi:hypothetical protein NPIL_543061 [Nephila pilipes]|uniref:Uncharacterized protein n=1 Tax=Nephila pilipes TaxID=299642 RepID=A0A8X6QPA9_NEPPI|nr:hypothetical protein NPIL_543061 [Nephila pilipes]
MERYAPHKGLFKIKYVRQTDSFIQPISSYHFRSYDESLTLLITPPSPPTSQSLPEPMSFGDSIHLATFRCTTFRLDPLIKADSGLVRPPQQRNLAGTARTIGLAHALLYSCQIACRDYAVIMVFSERPRERK